MISVVVPVHDEERSVALLYDELALGARAARRALGGDLRRRRLDRRHVRRADAAARARRRTCASSGCAATSARRPRSRPASRRRSGEIVVTIDGDLQDDPAEIPRLLAKLDEGFDLVSGWKTHRRDPLSRRILSRIFNRVAGRVSGVRLHDMNCGLKAYRAEVVHGLRLYGELHRFIPVLAHYRGFRIAELPVNHRPREHGRSRYGVERYLRGFLDLLTVVVHRPLPPPAAAPLRRARARCSALVGSAILVYLTVRQDRSGTRSASGRC